MTTKRPPPARKAATPRREAAPARTEQKSRGAPSVRRLDEDPTAIIRHFVQTLERMSGRRLPDDDR
jgi:hypothetical protein